MLEDTETEHWLPVVHWETSHEVSDFGRVRSIDRWVTRRGQHKAFLVSGKLTTQTKTDHGYYVVTLKCGGKKITEYVHTLVLTAFVGPRPLGYEGIHGPLGKLDNHLTNLQWGTSSDNKYDRRRDGTDPMLNRTNCPRNHALVLPNLVPSQLPDRSCLACERAHNRHKYMPRNSPEFKACADRLYELIMAGQYEPWLRLYSE